MRVLSCLFLVFLLSVGGFANDLRAVYTDTFVGDTNAIRVDTTNLPTMDMSEYDVAWFVIEINPDGARSDTNFAYDSIWVELLTSFDGLTWKLYDTLATLALDNTDTTIYSAKKYKPDSLYTGQLIMPSFIYTDSCTEADINGNAYYREFKVFVESFK